MLQQHVEANGTDEMDEQLETNHTQNGKIEFHDDSDEVLLMICCHSHRIETWSMFSAEDWKQETKESSSESLV